MGGGTLSKTCLSASLKYILEVLVKTRPLQSPCLSWWSWFWGAQSKTHIPVHTARRFPIQWVVLQHSKHWYCARSSSSGVINIISFSNKFDLGPPSPRKRRLVQESPRDRPLWDQPLHYDLTHAKAQLLAPAVQLSIQNIAWGDKRWTLRCCHPCALWCPCALHPILPVSSNSFFHSFSAFLSPGLPRSSSFVPSLTVMMGARARLESILCFRTSRLFSI